MAEVVWDPLAKKVDDKTTISEEIDGDMQTHNEDPSAHKQTGEAIDTHRVAEILDHLDRSVSPEKITDDKHIVRPSWESWDMLTIFTDPNADIDMQMGAIQLEHIAEAGNAARVSVDGTFDGINFPVKHPRFETIFYTGENYASEIYAVMGGDNADSVGFKIVNDMLYTLWQHAGSEHLYSLPAIYVGERHHYLAEVLSNTQIKFYVDGELVHSVTNAVLTSQNAFPFIFLEITSTDDEVGSFRVFTTRFWQDV